MTETHAGEAQAVTLARLEGKFDRIGDRVMELMPVVAEHTRDIHELKMATASLASEALARDRTVLATAAALKDAKDAAEGIARAEAAKKDEAWSPVAKGAVGLSALVALSGAAYGVTQSFLTLGQ